ncbi:MAG: hypothetical protein LUE88_04030 [Clostridiales bacterium]|nr:hypothetical protein [Clostridiales bacterium]
MDNEFENENKEIDELSGKEENSSMENTPEETPQEAEAEATETVQNEAEENAAEKVAEEIQDETEAADGNDEAEAADEEPEEIDDKEIEEVNAEELEDTEEESDEISETDEDLAEIAETDNESDDNEVSEEIASAEDSGGKKGLWTKWKEKELAKQKAKEEKQQKSEENMRRLREQRRAEMYADGNEPNAVQKFLMDEGKFINYENRHSVILAFLVIFGIVVFVLVYRAGFITKEKFGLDRETSRAIVYTKDNELYCYDLKNDPVLISENLSNGGSITYSYVGSGITVAEDGTSVYFIDNVEADRTFSFNFYDADKKTEPIKIADGVADYRVSTDGDGAVYIIPDETGSYGTLYGYTKGDEESSEIAQNIGLNGTDYEISYNGEKAVFIVEEGSSLSLNVCDIDGTDVSVVDSDVAQYIVNSEDKYVYYVKAVGADDGTTSYSIYKYDLKKASTELVDSGVIAVTLSSDENAVIYYKYNSDKIKASDIVIDDGDDSEETNALREAIADYEFRDIACSIYRYEDGDIELINDEVFAAMPMDSEGKYIAYTVPQGLNKITVNLSEISTVTEISALYYMQAMQADCDTYVYKLGSFSDYVPFENSYLYSFQNSGNDAQFACLANYDESSQTGQLVLSTYYEKGIKAYSLLEEDVESFQFLGDGSRIVYFRGVQSDGTGTLVYIESNVSDEISDSAYYYEAATDLYRRVFYLDDYDSETYGGAFHYYQEAKYVDIDDNVYMFAYRNNNNAFYMKDYNALTGTGDLYYYDGKNAVLVDEDVSSVFDFYEFS